MTRISLDQYSEQAISILVALKEAPEGEKSVAASESKSGYDLQVGIGLCVREELGSRGAAKWKEAVATLERHGIITPRIGDGIVYELTESGWYTIARMNF